MLSNVLQCTEQPPQQRIIRTKMSTVPRLGNTVLEQLINVEKIFKMGAGGKGNFQGLFLAHCFLNPTILGASSAVSVCKLETDLNFWARKSKHYG